MSDWVFCGSGRFGAKVLWNLISRYNNRPSVVFTLSDRVGGRGYKLIPTPVKKIARKYGLNVVDVIDREVLVAVSRKYSCLVVCDFGLIFPKEAVELENCVNVHPSLLPKWRGPAPIFWTLKSGDDVSGVSLFLMDKGVDTGKILFCRKINVDENANYFDLEESLANLAASILVEDFQFKLNAFSPYSQEGESSYARKFTKNDLKIDWFRSALEIKNLVRAASPYWGTWTLISGKRLKIFSVYVEDKEKFISDVGVGKILGIDKEKGILVSCGRDGVYLLELQLEGKRRMDFREFWNGYKHLLENAVLGV